MSSVIKRKPKPNAPASATDESISKATEKLKGILDAMKGTDAEPVPMPRGAPSPALMYKLMGKIFAILSVRGEAFVIVKCDPSHADLLRQSYGGIGHRSENGVFENGVRDNLRWPTAAQVGALQRRSLCAPPPSPGTRRLPAPSAAANARESL